ncbi:MAG TPA: hypothetical protein VEU77_12160 [Candidatus Acidoferrales bacterium]|nr:hypothetical protein [Candidatus Acidoferrales bacterium]
MLPGWRFRRGRRRRALFALWLLIVVVLVFAVCARRTDIVPRSVVPEAICAVPA